MSSKTILIVDDSPMNIQILGLFIKSAGFNLQFATDGESALNTLKKETVDLIISDIRMPGMDGFELLETINKSSKLKNIPIILLSADCNEEDLIKGKVLGAVDYLTKPFNKEDILSCIKVHIN